MATTVSYRMVSDGCGAVWLRCEHTQCDLRVVAPGRAQCSQWCRASSGVEARAGVWAKVAEVEAAVAALKQALEQAP